MCNYLNVALNENNHITYLYWWNVVWFTRENTISNHWTLVTPSGSGHLLLTDQRDGKTAWGLFFLTAQSSAASRVALIQCRVQAQQFKFPSTIRAMASSNRLNRPWHVSPARVRLANQHVRSFGFACAPTNSRMNVNKTQKTVYDVISINLSCSRAYFTYCTNFKPLCTKRYVPANVRGN